MIRLVTVSGPDAGSLARELSQYLLGNDWAVTLDADGTRTMSSPSAHPKGSVTLRVRKAAAPSADARQWLAGLALAGLLARNGTVDVDRAPAEAVRAADGVLAELAKEQA
jgi:hypothetical protein